MNNGLEDPAQVEKELNAQLRSMGLYAANITGDGNCLFRALSDQLYGYPNQHAILRQNVCDYLESRSDKFAAFIDVEKPFEDYVRSMRQSGTYGGHLELSAFAHLKQKEIKIVQPGLVYVVSGDDESPQAIQERERKEHERLMAQNRSQPGSEGPPPSERALRRMRRAKKGGEPAPEVIGPSTSTLSSALVASDRPINNRASSPIASESTESVNEVDRQTALASPAENVEARSMPSTSAVVTTPPPTQISQIEAYGPLWIAYHNWEHYSSIRNINGPHAGLPRINEGRSSASGQSAAQHGASNGAPVQEDEENPEPTTEEALVLRSTRGYTLQQVRFYIKRHGGWEEALEAILANETVADEEGEHSSDHDAMAESQSTMLAMRPRSITRSDTVGSSNVPTPLGESTDVSARTSHSPMPDHMRDWRAVSPSSVDTIGTHSSIEGASASTHATTDDSPEASGSKSKYSSDVRRSKRNASKDPTSSLRSPKRRSRSRSPMQPGEKGGSHTPDIVGSVAANAIANMSVHSGEQTPSDWADYASSPLGRISPDEGDSSSAAQSNKRSIRHTRTTSREDPEKTPRAKTTLTPRPVTRNLSMHERKELRKAEKVRKALNAKAKREQKRTGQGSDDEGEGNQANSRNKGRSGRPDMLSHHGDVKGFLELKI